MTLWRQRELGDRFVQHVSLTLQFRRGARRFFGIRRDLLRDAAHLHDGLVDLRDPFGLLTRGMRDVFGHLRRSRDLPGDLFQTFGHLDIERHALFRTLDTLLDQCGSGLGRFR